MANTHKTRRRLELLSVVLGLSLIASGTANIDPDPSIYDAVHNGASSNGGNIQTNSTPLGGQIQVVNESQLPPIDIQTNIPGINGNGINLPGAATGAIAQAAGGGSSGLPPIFGGGSGGQSGGGQQSPFPPPPSSQSQQGGQQGQQGQMPQGQQSQQGGQQGQQGQMPQGQQSQQGMQGQQGQQGQMSQQGQQGQQGMQGQQGQQGQMSQQGQQGQMGQQGTQSISQQLPPAPPEHGIGDQTAQIDPNGEMSQEGGEEGSEEGGSGETAQNQKARKKGPGGQQTQGEDASEGDGQAMPDDIGGSSGSKRGKGTIDDVAVPTNL